VKSCAVSGKLTLPDNSPAGSAQIRLRLQNFLQGMTEPLSPSTARDTYTDSDGQFNLAGFLPGAYTVEVFQGDSLAWMQRIVLSPKITTILSGELDTTGKYRGFIALPDSAPNFFVQIYGLARRYPILPTGSFGFSLPPGEYDFRVISESSLYRPLIIPKVIMLPNRVTITEEINSGTLLIKPARLDFPAMSFPKP
jgi:hypothetical protein